MNPFVLDDLEKRRVKQFAAEQDKKAAQLQNSQHPRYGASGGGYSYIFTPTGLGMIIHIRNNITNEEKDITNYSTW